ESPPLRKRDRAALEMRSNEVVKKHRPIAQRIRLPASWKKRAGFVLEHGEAARFQHDNGRSLISPRGADRKHALQVGLCRIEKAEVVQRPTAAGLRKNIHFVSE